jgi:hypothetical protein
VGWIVEAAEEFADEFADLPAVVQDELAAMVRLLEQFGPSLKRPHCDTLKGSRFSNIKELRFDAADGAWRVGFAFDPKRRAVLLVAGDKNGVSEKRFYKRFIGAADRRFADHLERMRET